jgi:chromosome segregation ATPase
VLYLAEVQRKTRVIGSGRAELKLLACQRSEQSWSAVPAEEAAILAPDDANYGAGTLVMVELTASRQVQRHSEASRQLVSILQNFSRLQEKFKNQEGEIEVWKESLTFQSQELSRREIEMETRQEQLQQMEEDFEQLEQQRQEIATAQDEVNHLRAEFDRKTQELEGAWAQLRGEMNRFEEQQSSLQAAAGLDADQVQQIQELLNRFSISPLPTESAREQLNLCLTILTQQQETLNYHWHNLEQQRAAAHQLQAEVDHRAQEILTRWQEWHQAQRTLELARAELKTQQSNQALQQQYAQTLAVQQRSQEVAYQHLCQLAETYGGESSSKVNMEALEKMPLEQLQAVVQDLQRDLEKSSRFVQSQEDELTVQQETIDELKTRIPQASEYDRLNLETELADEQDRYQMLNQTLVGQRRNLQEREAVLKQHQLVLSRRQGLPTPDAPERPASLDPILLQLETLRNQQSQEFQKLEAQVQQAQGAIAQLQETVNQQTAAQEAQFNELQQFEQHWQSQRATASELWGKVNTYQDTLQPMQDGVNGLREQLDAIAGTLNQFQEASDYQTQAIAEMQHKIQSLTEQSSEFVMS